MACIRTITCKECGLTLSDVVDGSGICQTCRHSIKSATRRRFLMGLHGLTIKERLARIEAQLYDEKQKPRGPISYG